MEVEFVYWITGREKHEDLEAAADRAHNLNPHIASYQLDAEENGLTLRIRAQGHDRSAVARRLVAPIRAIFHRAGVTPDLITLRQQTVLPNGRHKTLADGRTPKGTYATQELGQMIADAAKMGGEDHRGV